MALGVVPAWSGRYILDFEQVIAEVRDSATRGDGETIEGEAEEDDGGDEPHFSLITGKLVTSKRYGDGGGMGEENRAGKEGAGGVLVPRNQERTVGNLIGSAAGEHVAGHPDFSSWIIEIGLGLIHPGEFLQTRSWQGLEQRVGMDEPSVLEQGRDGIAKGYRGVDH